MSTELGETKTVLDDFCGVGLLVPSSGRNRQPSPLGRCTLRSARSVTASINRFLNPRPAARPHPAPAKTCRRIAGNKSGMSKIVNWRTASGDASTRFDRSNVFERIWGALSNASMNAGATMPSLKSLTFHLCGNQPSPRISPKLQHVQEDPRGAQRNDSMFKKTPAPRGARRNCILKATRGLVTAPRSAGRRTK